MRCSSCGKPSTNDTCDECGLNLVDSMTTSEIQPSVVDADALTEPQIEHTESEPEPSKSRLIEFPGVSRSSMPEWRKELAERVREAQDRRAREAAAEAELGITDDERSTPQLELLPQAEVPPMNPIVAAALRRIERAHTVSGSMAHARRQSTNVALAYVTDDDYPSLASEPLDLPMTDSPTLLPSPIDDPEPPEPIKEEALPTEKTHTLVVVPPQIIPAKTEVSLETKPRPRKIIGDDINNPALNYLDSVSTTIHPEDVSNRASTFSRIAAGILDLVILALLFAPFAVGVRMMNLSSFEPQVIALAAGTTLVLSFLYSTISTALTGRTLGMKVLGLRVIDLRTGLIPTGKQSAGRALLFNVTLLTAGTVLAFVLLDSEKRAVHDRFTRTVVISS